MRIYQTHDPAQPGMSDSPKKLNRLKLPNDMSGKSVLDIGCNEGYFCRVAKERGADRVVGIDFDRDRLNVAIERYASLGIDFRKQSWDTLPEGKFDYIFWTSAMHYERNPKKVTSQIAANSLTDNGLFILECGVIEASWPEMRYVVRHSDVCAYPTRPYLLNEILADYAVREVSPGEITEGDPVPRAVFHCRRIKPELMIVRGGSGVGKTSFVHRHLSPIAAKVIHLDYFLTTFCRANFAHSEFLKFVQKRYNPNDLGSLYTAIDEHEFTTEYVNLLCGVLSPTDRLTVIEGFLTDTQFAEMKKRLAGKFKLWEVSGE